MIKEHTSTLFRISSELFKRAMNVFMLQSYTQVFNVHPRDQS